MIFHCLLLKWGMTTNEYYRGKFKEDARKYVDDNGFIVNCLNVFCKPTVASELPLMTDFPGMDDEGKDMAMQTLALAALQTALSVDDDGEDDGNNEKNVV